MISADWRADELEAEDIRSRAETLVAITEIALARSGGEHGGTLQ